MADKILNPLPHVVPPQEDPSHPEKKMAHSWTKVLLLVGIALSALGVAVTFWNDAFPTATLDFRFSKTEIKDQMKGWIESQGYPLTGYYNALSFSENDDTRNYLELETGLHNLNHLTNQGINIWHWDGRWFKPEQKEELGISLDPQGHLILYNHTIEEARAVPTLKKKRARELAEHFIETYITQHPFDKLRFVQDSTRRKPKRVDYTFTWEREDLRVKGEAPYRLEVKVQGNQIGSYEEYLKIPESWSRKFAKQRELNFFCGRIAEYATYPILMGFAVLFILYVYQRRLDWRSAPPKGWLVLFAVIMIAGRINNIPDIIDSYETTGKWASYVMENISSAILQTVLGVAAIWFLIMVVDPLYRQQFPQNLPFRVLLGSHGLKYRETLRSIGLGTVFACVSMGYVCLFYVIAKSRGAWSPVEINYSKALGGWIPWIQPIQIGLSASFEEEMIFRALAISLYQKIFRSRWFAIVLAAGTWGFLHSTYPQMPGYIRGTELTIVGILWGFLMIRYGILTTLVAHYLYDCWLSSFILFYSPEWSNRIGAMVASLWPIIFGIWGWWKYARTQKLEDAFPDKIPRRSTRPGGIQWWEIPSGLWDISVRTISNRLFCVLLLAATFILTTLHFLPLPSRSLNRLGEISLDRKQIEEKADQRLREQAQNPNRFKKIISISGTTLPMKYLLEYKDLNSVAQLFQKEWPDLQWNLRYFRFGEKEEFYFSLDKNGRLISRNRVVSREDPGASLEKEEALSLAKQYLKKEHGLNFSDEILVQDHILQQEKRRDFHFIFERTSWDWGESKLRTNMMIQGDEALGVHHYIKVPEAWLREQSFSGWKEAFVNQFFSWFKIIKWILFAILFVLMLQKNILSWKIWRFGFLIALIPTLWNLLNWFNKLPWFFSDYDTVIPVFNFTIRQIGDFALNTFISYLSEVFTVGITLGLLCWAFHWRIQYLSIWSKEPVNCYKIWRTSFALGLIGTALLSSKSYLDAFVYGWFFPHKVAYFYFPAINAALPWLSSLLDALLQGYHGLFGTALKGAGAVILYRRFPKTVWSILLLMPILYAMNSKTWDEFGLVFSLDELEWFLTFFLVWKIWRFDALAIFLTYSLSSLIPSIGLFLLKGGPHYQWQAIPLIAAFSLPLALSLIQFRQPKEPSHESSVRIS